MNCVWLFLSTLLYLAEIKYHEVNGLGFDDLDFARSAIETVAKPITFKTPMKTVKYTGGGWSFWRSYRSTKKVRTSKPRNLNKFNEAMNLVERAMAQAELSGKTAKLSNLKKDITDAINRGNVRFARRALGIAFYTANKETKSGKRTTGYDAKMFLKDIKKDLGDDKFSDFLALQGQVSLVFALDVTGSMRDEIKAAKNIIKQISQYDRSEPVDYVLTTFSDPIGLTTCKRYEEYQVSRLISHVDRIRVTGGGDCPEYSFDGMVTALSDDPELDSPLYVFTDAPPKDADEESQETLKALAEDLEITINFFVGKRGCGSERKLQPFKDIVEARGGLYLPKLDPNEMTKMASYTSSSLNGNAAVMAGKGKTGRRKRRATTYISFPIDDTVSQLIVTVTTDNSPHGIHLYTPTGHPQTAGKTVLSRVKIFSVDNPIKGLWRLLIPSSVGRYEYTAKVISPENIDFEHHFSKMERRKSVRLRNPLAGQSSKVSITLSGAAKIEKSSLLVDLIDISGNTLIANKKPTTAGKSGIRFTLDLVPPHGAFKLLLKGRTIGGKNFQRISRHVDSAKPLVVKEYYTYRHYTIPLKGRTTILFYLFNGLSNAKRFDVLFRTKKGYTASLHGSQARASRMNVRGRRKKYLRVTVRYNGGTPGEVGKTLNVVIIVKGRDKSFVTAEIVPLMFIKG